MKIQRLKLKNFRGFRDEVEVKFDNLTALVGKNDIGKTTILEALDIFFNDSNAANKLAPTDLNVDARDCEEMHHEISIAVCFSDLPEQIITNTRTIRTRLLLNKDGELEIVKKYEIKHNKDNSTKTFMEQKVFIRICNSNFSQISVLADLKNLWPEEIIELQDILHDIKFKKRSILIALIELYNRALLFILKLPLIIDQERFIQLFINMSIHRTDEIEITTKSIWKNLQNYLPLYSLFQADRKNTDSDKEVQDPLKDAVKAILSDNTLQQKLNEVASTVEAKLNEVAARTKAKLSEMNPAIAKTLKPVIPPANTLNWQDVFKNVSIASDEDIPINKRGSGVKRLILLNFFRAEVERRQHETNLPNVIYAIEEPETSQHSENQKKLIKALSRLAETNGVQIIITTHSPIIVKALNFDNIRIVSKDNKGSRKVINTPPQVLPYRSLNEVNYIAFSEISEEYHDELYGHMIERGWKGLYKQHKKLIPYTNARYDNKGHETTWPENLTKTEIIRNQIHHPENKHNPHRFTEDELRTSIEEMRKFIQAQYSKTDQQE